MWQKIIMRKKNLKRNYKFGENIFYTNLKGQISLI